MYKVYANDLIAQVAEELKGSENIVAPEWASYVKTGSHKERPPVESDWWYTRSAAILRTVAVLGPVGVEKLRRKYGGRKNRGVKPDRFRKASGNIIRKVLQQLEKDDLIKFTEKGVHKGRVVTPKGQSMLDKAAIVVMKKQGGQ
jgi:small subunit ribosomal protein S19e